MLASERREQRVMKAKFEWSFGETDAPEPMDMGIGEADPLLRMVDALMDLGRGAWRLLCLACRSTLAGIRSMNLGQTPKESLGQVR
jgi:hypothetical protein